MTIQTGRGYRRARQSEWDVESRNIDLQKDEERQKDTVNDNTVNDRDESDTFNEREKSDYVNEIERLDTVNERKKEDIVNNAPMNESTSSPLKDKTSSTINDNRNKHSIPNQRKMAASSRFASSPESLEADKRRKRDLLHAKPDNIPHSNWEDEQFRKATQGAQVQAEKIEVVTDAEYDFVFDEAQFVDFDEDEDHIAGDDNEEEEEDLEVANDTSLQALRQSLPVYKYREDFLQAIQTHQFLVVVGETGSGKTTQLPQYLHEAGYSRGPDGEPLVVGCTQPRRVAATSVAARVADEMATKVGDQVGYSVRFDEKSSANTVVKYMTDGMLLREFLADPHLARYGAIMVDEAHERTLSTEVLLGLLKGVAKARPSLRVIVASATINAERFSDFFGGAPILNIPGRRFPVDVHYTKQPEANYIQAAITTVFQIHLTTTGAGDILVFLTGQDEIEQMEEALVDAVHKLGNEIAPLLVCPIYANLAPEQQARIFEPTPPGSRKVVLATNIAETSITIPGVAFVVDPGYVKQNVYNAATGMDSLVVVPCLRASADQRAGRSGRVGPGKCFRLYTKWSFYNELEANPVPEILRTNLVSTLLLLLSLGITDLINFDFMDAPSPDAIMKALELLYALGALSSQGGLTAVGRRMAQLPIDPMFTKALLCGAELGVLDDVLSVVAVLGEASALFYRPKDKKEEADRARERLADPAGDHLTLLRVWNEWVGSGYLVQWCQDHYIQYKTMRRAKSVREQLERLCKRIVTNPKEDPKQSISRSDLVRKAIVAGFFPHVVRLLQMGDSYRRLKKNQVVSIHPSLVLYGIKPPARLILFHELVLTSKEYMRNCMIVEDEWVKEYGAHYYSGNELRFLERRR